jgi:hypothetical protein
MSCLTIEEIVYNSRGQNMKNKRGKIKLNWFWGCIGFCGILGYILNEPLYYLFFAFFLFFLEPIIKKSKK